MPLDKTLAKELQDRRSQFIQTIGRGSVAILSSMPEYVMNGLYTNYPYRQLSDFYYLTGLTEPKSFVVFVPGRAEGEFILFVREVDPTKEMWDGKMAGLQGSVSEYGADQAFPVEKFQAMLPELLLGRQRLYFDISRDPEFDEMILHSLNLARMGFRNGRNVPDDITHIGKVLHEMRLRKRPYEIEILRKSVNIGVAAHFRAMRACRPGMFEYELEAELCHEYIRHGGKVMAFEPIVASGANACTLHYIDKNAPMRDGDLVLIDSGVDYQYYMADLTRTFPVGKKFTPEQKTLYQVVLNAQLATINIVRPGIRRHELLETAERTITEDLLKLGILRGDFETLCAEKVCKKFFVHNIGHWLGMDTHDVGKYAVDEEWRILEPGMTFTVEPGIYIPHGANYAEKKWHGIGIRIEDNVLVTEHGHEVLSAALPKTVEEIEALRNW